MFCCFPCCAAHPPVFSTRWDSVATMPSQSETHESRGGHFAAASATQSTAQKPGYERPVEYAAGLVQQCAIVQKGVSSQSASLLPCSRRLRALPAYSSTHLPTRLLSYLVALEEVGQQFSVTRERIRQIEAKALRKLKHPTRSRKLRSFLEATPG